MSKPKKRTQYGASKYAALHLLLCRWLRLHAAQGRYRYVTLGGTELRDVLSLRFIDNQIVSSARSYEENAKRYPIAMATRDKLAEFIQVDVQRGDFFDYERVDELPHIFFLDLEGICARANFHVRFAEMFQNETIREGDFLLITSHLGHIGGPWPKVFRSYNGEYTLLGAEDEKTKKSLYRRAHPSFTLFHALEYGDLAAELLIRCIGCVEYTDTSPMGLYGYVFRSGTTSFHDFINDAEYLHFHIKKGFLMPPAGAAANG